MKVLKNDNNYLTMDDLMGIIKELSYSQGFYGRLYRDLIALRDEQPDDFLDVKEDWESQKFTDSLDFILYLES